MERGDTRRIILLLILFFIICFIASKLTIKEEEITETITIKNTTTNTTIQKDNEIRCENLSLSETAYCLNDFVEKIYKYRITEKKIPFEELKREGGDCEDWSLFYQKMFSKYGYRTKYSKIFVEKIEEGNLFHIFLIAYDKKGYCVLDQLNIACMFYGEEYGD